MTLEQELELSYYKDAAPINESHGIWLVQDQRSGKFYVRKTLTVFNKDIYRYLKNNPIHHTPKIHHVVEDGSTLVVIEDYIPGDTLEEILAREGSLPETQVLDIAIQLCKILQAFHHAVPPIVNRDIKPSNIKLTEDGIVKLLDMNAAKYCNDLAAKDTVLLGTQGYAAPEQYGFGASNVQTDIYAVGVLMNVLLTGKLPAEEKATGKLRGIIAKCTKLAPEQRYSSIDSLLAALCVLKPVSASDTPKESGWRKFLPPGFHSDNLLLSALSFVGYAFLLFLCLNIQVTDATPLRLIVNRIGATIAFFSCVLFTGNYLNVQSKFFLTRSKNLILRILGIVIADIVLFFCVVAVVSMLESFVL